jgi:hypothetical protein
MSCHDDDKQIVKCDRVTVSLPVAVVSGETLTATPVTPGTLVVPMLTLGGAAKLTNQSKTTLTRAIKSGKLSAIRKDDGSYEIDPSELSRVYTVTPELHVTPETGGGTVAVVREATHPETVRDPELVAKLAALDAEVAGLKALLSEVRQARDDWKDQAVRLALVKPAEVVIPSVPASVAVSPTRPRLSDLWKKLAG